MATPFLSRDRAGRWLKSGVSRILIGSAIGQGTLLASAPLLTRIYTPADFGALTAFTAVIAVVASLATLSWERAVAIPRSEHEASAMVWLGCIASISLAALLAPAAWFAGPHADALFGTRVFVSYWWLVPVAVLALGFYAMLSAWLVRNKAYGSLAERNALLGLSQAVSSVAIGIAGFGAIGLLSGSAVGRLSALVGVAARRRHRPILRPSRSLLSTSARRFRKFPLVATWSRAINVLGQQMAPILLVALYTSVEVGLYALTLRVLATPIGIVVDAVSQYFEGIFAERVRDQLGGLGELVKGTAQRLLLVGIGPAAFIALLAPYVFSLAFGIEWTRAGFFAQITVAAYLAQFVVSPISRTLLVLERQAAQIAWDAMRTISVVGAVAIPFALGGTLVTALLTMTAVQVLLYVVLYGMCVRAANNASRNHEPGTLSNHD